MFRLLLSLLTALAAHGVVYAQVPTSENSDPPALFSDLPPVPPDQILDEAGLLDPSTRAGLRQQIQKLKAQANVDLFVAAYTLLPEKIATRAQRLRDHWGKSDRSVMVVYRRGSQELTFSANGNNDTFIPIGELLLMYEDAITAALAFESPRERILAAVQSLSTAIIRDLAIRDTNRSFFTAEIIKLIAAITATILVIGGIALLFVRRAQSRAHKRETGCVFPEVAVSRRLGAPFGGGTVADINFAKPVNSPQSSEPRHQSS